MLLPAGGSEPWIDGNTTKPSRFERASSCSVWVDYKALVRSGHRVTRRFAPGLRGFPLRSCLTRYRRSSTWSADMTWVASKAAAAWLGVAGA